MAVVWHPQKVAYLDSVIAQHPNMFLRARLVLDRSQISVDTVARNQHPALSVGDSVPAFNFRSIDDTSHFVTRDSMHGKMFVIDFWATWCGACIEEIPYIQKAYEQYRDRGLSIISVSFDETPAKVKDFRKGELKMPWFNAWARVVDPSVVPFGISVIPHALLVDPHGTIVASGEELQGDGLGRQLAKYFSR
jgi:thiol-disulfide isomerase/thioredoxin